ncbi:MAG TPA: hypothetical protein VI895_11925 [Bdellovibrionota bacterium]|nr:hypothetical protein [Bdellovibrionota bacterium]
MHGLHHDIGFRYVVFSLILEVIFLGFCTLFVGLGVSELKKHKPFLPNAGLIGLGFCLAGLSLYVTKLLIEG